MSDQEFEDRFQTILLLIETPENTDWVMTEYSSLLADLKQALKDAKTLEEGMVIEARAHRLRILSERQWKFLVNLKEKALAECWPDKKPPAQEVLN